MGFVKAKISALLFFMCVLCGCTTTTLLAPNQVSGAGIKTGEKVIITEQSGATEPLIVEQVSELALTGRGADGEYREIALDDIQSVLVKKFSAVKTSVAVLLSSTAALAYALDRGGAGLSY